MADHDEAQDYKANGPTDVGFRTGGDGTGITNGVVATGIEIGVSGTSLGTPNSNKLSVGVIGKGETFGVQGISQNGDGVFGSSDKFSGVKGTGGDFGAGVAGFGTLVGVSGEGEVTGVKGNSNGDGAGVMGDSGKGVGVDGHSGRGPGVRGRSDSGYGGVFTGNFAQIRLEPSADLKFGPPTTGAHLSGEFFVDGNGTLFYCRGGSPPRWERLAGPSLISSLVSDTVNFVNKILGRNP